MSSGQDALAQEFEQHREFLARIAYRILGSLEEAEDAIQEAWLRLARSKPGDIDNLASWLTTVVSRVCLDKLRSHRARQEESLDHVMEHAAVGRSFNPEEEAQLASSVGLALMVVLERLDPPQRLAFVLHDMFDLSFEEIASIVGRTPAATRQLASRARKRVRGATVVSEQIAGQRRAVGAFISALRAGDLEGLIAVLDPDVVFRAQLPGQTGTYREVVGARNWAKGALAFAQAAQFMQPALIDGAVGLVLAPRGRLQRALTFTFADDGRIQRAVVIDDPAALTALGIAVLD